VAERGCTVDDGRIEMASAAMPFLRLYPAFAAGYLLSYFYRNVNAVISPDLTRELSLSPGALGLLTAVYFVAFAGMQLPAGMLLDRYGPRRVEPALLLIAAAGVLLFAVAGSEGGLLVARALIGTGVAICLMAPLKAIATWYPKERQASLGGWMMVAGSVGALVATAPLEFALRFVSWRLTFVALAVTTCAAALLIWWFVPDTPTALRTVGLRAQWRGVCSVFAHPRFWWIAPLAALGIGSFMALQGLWAVPWLIEVNGFDRAVAAQHLLVMGVTMLVGYVALGLYATRLARHGMYPRHLFAAGFGLSALALGAILATLPGTWLWWALYGLGATVNVLGFTVLNDGFAIELTGRSNTALNLVMFIGSFAAQWGIGVVVDVARSGLGLDIAGGLKLAFGIALALYTLGYAWFAWGWRRHGAHAAAAV
jgi:predicted MFS family arabinose efflux permease